MRQRELPESNFDARHYQRQTPFGRLRVVEGGRSRPTQGPGERSIGDGREFQNPSLEYGLPLALT